MSISLIILDGLLLAVFVVGCIEATASKYYHWTWWRFLRADSLPVGIGVFAQLATAHNWWPTLLAPLTLLFTGMSHYGMDWAIPTVGAIIAGGFLLFRIPLAILRLVGFIIRQFYDDNLEKAARVNAFARDYPQWDNFMGCNYPMFEFDYELEEELINDYFGGRELDGDVKTFFEEGARLLALPPSEFPWRTMRDLGAGPLSSPLPFDK